MFNREDLGRIPPSGRVADTTQSGVPGAGGPVGTINNIKTRSWAGFGQAEWQISDQWTAILGGRVTEDERTDNYLLYAPTPQTVVTVFNTAQSRPMRSRIRRIVSPRSTRLRTASPDTPS